MTGQLFPAPVQPFDKDERYTPRWVFDGLGLTFDLDPCSPVAGGDCVPTRHRYTLDDDGLTQPWHGLVWVNPPFSQSTVWADRFVAHGNGLFLGPVANSKWRARLLAAARLIWLCDDFAFTHPTHAGQHSSMPLMFVAYGDHAAAALRRLARSGVHGGTLVTVTV